MEAHQEVNYLLTREQKKALHAEAATVRAALTALEKAVVPYRTHIEQALVGIRARQRVGDYLVDTALRQADGSLRPHQADLDAAVPGGFSRVFSGLALSKALAQGYDRTAALSLAGAAALRSLPASVPGTGPLADALERAGELLAGFNKTRAEEIESERLPLKGAVERALFALREALEQADGRLRSHFPQSFIESLYPELDRAATKVSDEPPDEDDDHHDPPGGDPVTPTAKPPTG